MPVGLSSTVLEALNSENRCDRIGALVDLEADRTIPQISVVERLIELLADVDKEIRRRAAGALVAAASSESCRAALTVALDDTDQDRRWGACFALSLAGQSSPRLFQAALDSLAHQDSDVCWAAANVVVESCRHDSTRVERLRRLVTTGEAEVRKMALYCLRDLGSSPMSMFAEALADEQTAVRLAALAGLFRLSQQPTGSPVERGVITRVRNCLKNDSDKGVRRASAAVLGRIMGSDGESRRALESAAGDSGDVYLARAARAALSRRILTNDPD